MTHLLNALAQATGVELAPAASRTSTLTGTGIDVLEYEGVALVLLNASAGTGTSPTLDVKLQHSDDDSTYEDVTSGAFSQVTDAAETAGVRLDDRERRLTDAAPRVVGSRPVGAGTRCRRPGRRIPRGGRRLRGAGLGGGGLVAAAAGGEQRAGGEQGEGQRQCSAAGLVRHRGFHVDIVRKGWGQAPAAALRNLDR